MVPVIVHERIVKDTCNYYDWCYDDLAGNLTIHAAPEEVIEHYQPNEWSKRIDEWSIFRQLNNEIPLIMVIVGTMM